MRCLKAQVKDNFDTNQEGMIWVYCPDESSNLIPVTYVSPYSAGHRGGMIAIPEAGTMVLITQPENSNEWYYMGSVFSQDGVVREPDKLLAGEKQGSVFDDRVYGSRGVPQQLVLQDPKGNALKLSSGYKPTEFNNFAKLRSGVGKTLLLSDSPDMNSVILRNEHGDRIKITSSEDVASPARAIEVQSRGPQKYYTTESQIDMRVVDGRDLNLTNTSTGQNATTTEPEQYGNINIESSTRDINLTVRESGGRVFIDALGTDGLIQLDSNGRVYISGAAGIDMVSDGDINIVSQSNVNIQAAQSINLISQLALALQSSTQVSVIGGPLASIDAAQIFFNSGVSQPAQSPSPGTKADNHNGD